MASATARIQTSPRTPAFTAGGPKGRNAADAEARALFAGLSSEAEPFAPPLDARAVAGPGVVPLTAVNDDVPMFGPARELVFGRAAAAYREGGNVAARAGHHGESLDGAS